MKLLIALTMIGMTNISTATDTTSVLKYLVREPKIASQHPPLLILLHGVGSNEQDLFSFADKLPSKYLVISAQAPIALGGNSFAWYQVDFSTGKSVYNLEQEKKSRQLLIRFIEQLKEKYAVNSHEIYLCGFSQGAIMSYSVALTRPDLVKGMAAISGRLLEEIKPEIAPKEKLKDLKILISHGTGDNTLSIQYAKTADAFLKTLGISALFKQYDAGHQINHEMLKDLVDWLK